MTDAFVQADYDPSIEPESSKAWLNLIKDAESVFATYQEKCDAIDKRYADLAKLAVAESNDRQFQMFWANIQVLAPATYSRPPVPVVVPRFQNRKPLPQTASELLERATTVSFDLTDIDSCMLLARDSLVRLARGVLWLRYEDKVKKNKKAEQVCIEYCNRRDFLHGRARNWSEVQWVAKRAWMTADEMKARFTDTSDDAWEAANFLSQAPKNSDKTKADPVKKAGVWEMWHKGENKVVWITDGVDVVLDSGEPHLTLDGFFPCPKPAYGTVEPDTLIPVPDYVYYKDQLSEINELTARISALSDALKIRGFYPSGGEIGDAIETALKEVDDNAIMIPISNWAAMGQNGNIIWLPVDMVAKVIVELVTLRKELINDVYEITGLSDIMRGQSDASETLGAQQLKSQYGSVRIRDKQAELVRLARDAARIDAEIMAENFDKQTLLDMTQMDLPSDADIKKQINDLEKQGKQVLAATKQKIEQAKANPQIAQHAQQNPQQAQQMIEQLDQQSQQQVQQIQGQIQKIGETITIDQVMKLLRDQRMRPFSLDIETDSTIQPDENAQKERATEFVGAIGSYMQQTFPIVQAMPQAAPFVGAFMKWISGQFRVGREMYTTIDEFADQMQSLASQPKVDPEAQKTQAAQAMQTMQLQADAQKAQAQLQMQQQELSMKAQIEEAKLQAEMQMKQMEMQHAQMENQARLQQISAQNTRDEQKHQMDMQSKQADHQIKMQQAAVGVAATAQNADIQRQQAEQEAAQSAQAFDQQQQSQQTDTGE